MSDGAALLRAIDVIAREAGRAILKVYESGFTVEVKSDNSPVTEADTAAEAIILRGLRRLTPDIPIVAEEEVAATGAPKDIGDRFWLVDPLDGTREFLTHNDEFTVNIALVEKKRPKLGVVHAPAKHLTFTGGIGLGATRSENGAARTITIRRPPARGLTVIASRRHGSAAELDHFLDGRPVAERINCGSSLKFCLVACGEADLYPRFGPTMEWDTAAGNAVLAAAGGRVTTADGAELLYRKPDFRNPNFIAWGNLD
jgi:3'(2'), 5'-bisphosphate nucleotidase